MKKGKLLKTVIFILAYNIASSCYAKIEFNCQGKPIQPNCVGSTLGAMGKSLSIKKTVLLSQCTKQAKGDPRHGEDGWLYSYFPKTGNPDPYLPKIWYKVFVQNKNGYLIGVRQWGGGSGLPVFGK